MASPYFIRLSTGKATQLVAYRRYSTSMLTDRSNPLPLNAREYRHHKSQTLRHNRHSPELEKKARLKKLYVPLEEVEKEWLGVGHGRGMHQLQTSGLQSHIFQDVFGVSFHPRGFLNISYCELHRVTWGNVILAEVTLHPPPVVTLPCHIKGNYASILMTDPDSHFKDISSPTLQELLHWMVINIPIQGGRGDVKDGLQLVSYLPPIPPRGTGFHRYVFSLYTHTNPLPSDSTHFCVGGSEGLKQRLFSSVGLIGSSGLKPWSFSFFQCQWDSSVSNTYKHLLNFPEPWYGPDITFTRYQLKNMTIQKSRQSKYSNL